MKSLNKQNKKMSFAELETVFGISRATISYRLRAGWSLSEALKTPINSYMVDVIGMRFSRLKVLYRIPGSRTREAKYHCVCDCGNECDVYWGNLRSGRQQSCGCLNKEILRNRHEDLSGQTINGVKLLKRTETEIDSKGRHYSHYLCLCPICNKTFDARINNVKTKNTRGCGCTRHQYTHLIDLTGQDFEFCHVNKRVENKVSPGGNNRTMYECVCCCGKTYIDWSFTILHGRSNCGCKKVRSLGEEAIEKWLDENNISYVPQYWFDDLRGDSNMPYYFDFALITSDLQLLALIEYQGEQHYTELKHSIKDFGKKQREVSDPAKRKYCKENGHKLFEIAFFENIPARCEEIIKLLYHDNTVPSLQYNAETA